MASDTPLKGILKNAIHGEQPGKRRPDARELAIQHARIIQQRKELELDILNSIEVLSFLPSKRGPEYSSAHPAVADIADFKTHVRLFQPGDYEDLIEERNANKLCGYTLCPKPKPAASAGGAWKLMNVGRPDFQIVDRKESERWCSDTCKKRALYVKVQLNETAAWERIGMPDIIIELYEEDKIRKDPATAETSAVQQGPDHKAAEDAAALALERGDVGAASSRMMTLTIREKNVEPPTESHDEDDRDDAADIVEGYAPGTVKREA